MVVFHLLVHNGFVEKVVQAVWLVGWLAGWLVGWLAGWLAVWLAGMQATITTTSGNSDIKPCRVFTNLPLP